MKHKRFFILLLLCASILVSSNLAAAETPQDSALQTAFESGSLSLQKIGFLSSSDDYTRRFPTAWEESDQLLQEIGTDAEVSADGNWITFTQQGCPMYPPFYYSPDGSTAIFLGNERYFGFVISDHTISMIRAGMERSVEDSYGAFEKFTRMIPNRWTGIEGLAWSPDSRYAAITNAAYFLRAFKHVYGLYVIDTQTGELLCLDTFPTDHDEGVTVLQACFDNESRYLYYMLIGKVFSNVSQKLALMRCDMETGETEKLLGGAFDIAHPKLQIDSRGRLWNLRIPIKSSEYGGLYMYTADGDAWTRESYLLPVPMKEATPVYMEITGDTGAGLLYIDPSYHGDRFSLPMRFFLSDTPAHFGEVLLISSFDAERAEALSLSDEAAADTLAAFDQNDGLKCLNIKLSPDGRYAMLLMRSRMEYGYLMMDTQTLALRRVSAPEEIETYFAGQDNLSDAGYAPGMNWFAGNKFVIASENGPALYALVYE